MPFTSFGAVSPLQLVATTGIAGFALQNATPVIATWTAPNDGNMHRVMALGELIVGSAETGGQISLTITDPGNTVRQRTVWNSGLGAGFQPIAITNYTIAPGSTVTLAQTAALTAGAAQLWAEVWGS
jgi:hypothetical protein